VGNLSLVLRNPVDRREASTPGMGKADLFSAPGGPVPVAVRSVPARTPTPARAASTGPASGSGASSRAAAAPAPTSAAAAAAAAARASPGAATEPPTRIEVIRGVARTTVEL
jgi:hypothetical protein